MEEYIYILAALFIIFTNILLFPSQDIFAADIFPSVLPQGTQSIALLGSTVTVKGITDQTNRVFLNSREIKVEKDGSFQADIIIPLGETEMIVAVADKEGKIREYSKKITAKDKYLFLVGIADGTLNIVRANQNNEWQRDNSTFTKGTHLDGKISYYLVGKIKGKYLIKSALDTEKSTQGKLFSNIDPNKYYPVYGDNSTVVYDVNSQGKFYLLVEWDKSGFTFGNYQTMIDDTELLQYNRTLYGGKVHLETPQRTIYGQPKAKATAFFAEANQYAGHSEFQGTGGSLYYLRHRNIVEGSEKVRLDIRDKNNGMTLYSIPQAENIDYEIKYDEGRILFKKPVLSVASSDTIISNSILEGNPVYIVVNYEYKSQEAFPITSEDLDKQSLGLRLTKSLGNHIQFGGTYIKENKDNKNMQFYGQDLTLKLGNFSEFNTEIAQSQAESVPSFISYNGGYDFTKLSQENKIKAQARKFSFASSLGEYLGLGRDFLNFSGYYQNIGNNFSSSDNLFQSGTEKYGMELAHKLTENDKLRFLAQREALMDEALNQAAKNQITSRRSEIYTGQWVHTWEKFSFTTEYQQRTEHGSLSFYQRPSTEKNLAERIDYKFNPDSSVFVSQQATLSGHSHNQSGVGFATKLADNTKIQAQTALGQAGNSALVGLEKNVNQNTSSYMTYSLVNSELDGKTATTSIGANTKIDEKAKLTTERQFITSDQRGVYASNLMGLDYQVTPYLSIGATYQRRQEESDPNLISSSPKDSVSLNTGYIKPDKLKAYNKFEFREDIDDTQQVLTDNSLEFKLNEDLTLFGEYDYSLTRKPGNASYARLDTRHLGLAYRPKDFDWFNCLFKYLRLVDERPADLNNADGGFVKADSIADVYATEFALDLPWHFQFVEKFSYKDEDAVAQDVLGFVKTPENLTAHLYVHRLNFHLTQAWDIAAEYRLLKQKATLGTLLNSEDKGFLFEVLRKIYHNLYVGAGYNFTSFSDNLTEPKHKAAKGFFFRLQGRH